VQAFDCLINAYLYHVLCACCDACDRHGDRVRVDTQVHTLGFLQNKLGAHRRDIRGSVYANFLRDQAVRVNKLARYAHNVYPQLLPVAVRKQQQGGARYQFQLGHKHPVRLGLTE
jgi:hypothetical protein